MQISHKHIQDEYSQMSPWLCFQKGDMLNRKFLFKRPRKVEKITQFDIKQILHGFEGDILEYLPRVDLLNFEPDVIFIQEGDMA